MLHSMDKLKLICNIGLPLPFAVIAELLAMILTAPKPISYVCNAVPEPLRFNMFSQPFLCLRSFKIISSVKWELKFPLPRTVSGEFTHSKDVLPTNAKHSS